MNGESKGASTDASGSNVYIRFRLSNLDVVQSDEPVSPWRFVHASPFYAPEPLRSVPVIRIYGATDKGQRVVAHARGCFPYLYCNYEGSLDPDSVHEYIKKLARALNKAVALSFKRESKQVPQFIAHIVLCKGVPIYGFHVGYKPYLKIYVTNPRYKKKVGMALRSGAVMRTVFEVFEEHIPYPLQFMLDHNLYGCGWVELSDCHFRLPLPAHQAAATDDFDPPTCEGPYPFRLYNDRTIDNDHISPDELDKISHCSLELDFHVSDIVNRDILRERPLHFDFGEYLHPEKIVKGKLVNSVRELWDDERRRRSDRGESGPTEVDDKEPREWDLRSDGDPIWRTEKQDRLRIQKRVQEDLARFRALPGNANRTPSFETYVRDIQRAQGIAVGWLEFIKTTFQQVDALYEERMTQDERDLYVYGAWSLNGIGFNWSQQHRPIIHKDDDADLDERLWQYSDDRHRDDLDLDENDEAPVGRMQAQRAPAQHLPAQTVRPAFQLDAEDFDEPLDPFLDDLDRLQNRDDSVLPQKRAMSAEDRESVSPRSLRRRTTSFSPELHKTPTRGVGPRQRTSSTIPSRSATPQVPATSAFRPPDLPVNVHFASEDASGFALAPSSPIMQESPPASPSPLETPRETNADIVNDTALLVSSSNLEPEKGPTVSSFSSPTPDRSPTPTLVDPGPETLTSRQPSDQLSLRRSNTVDTYSPTNDDQDIEPSLHTAEPASSVSSSLRAIEPDQDVLTGSSAGSLARPETSSRTASSGIRSPFDAYTLLDSPPTTAELYDTLEALGLPRVAYPDPFFSNPRDVPTRAFDFGGRLLNLRGQDIDSLKEFVHWNEHPSRMKHGENERLPMDASIRAWELARRPPTRREAEKWLAEETDRKLASRYATFAKKSKQVAGPTQGAPVFKVQNVKGASSVLEKQHLSVLAIELAMITREDLLPDPEKDPIVALFYCLQSENEDIQYNGREPDRLVGVIAVDNSSSDDLLASAATLDKVLGASRYRLDVVSSEIDLIDLFVEKVRVWDPEIFAGFEVHKASWGYLLERMRKAHDRNGVHEFGRVMEKDTGKHGGKANDKWGYQTTSTLGFSGRHVIPIWRTIKADNKLLQYSFEHIAYHVLHQRVPHYSESTLTKWLVEGSPNQRARVFDYYVNRVEMDIEMLEATEIVSQNSEAARVFGVDFNSVRTRGSQFKVEAVMFRIAKPESLLMPSPTREEVGEQNAAECQPLIQEPESAFYKSPVAVLDFQSLYPSVMIAYNFCFSTCLGRVDDFKGTWKLGTRTLELPPGLLWLLRDEIIVTPNSMMFVKSRVRKSLLAKMLTELLDTRVMVKDGMKLVTDKALTKILNARQLALKFLANVTYGYTSATFSGRMPCVEVADSIVATGRETLEAAKSQIHSNMSWGARCVYGDTDSLFVHMPGKSRDEAFRLGRQMAVAVTSRNPRPVKLKFEKIYLPCVLLAKKRYVGNKFEKESDEAEIDAKGIETIRRDGIVATQRMQERCLKILFRTSDLSQVKAYLLQEWTKIMGGDWSPQDFTYAKEVKPGSYSVPPPGMMVAERRKDRDARAEAEWGERVPYIIYADKDQKQANRAISPLEFVRAMPQIQIDVQHYIERAIIPPLARIFKLMGADVEEWYRRMTKTRRLLTKNQVKHAHERFVLESHFGSTSCSICGNSKAAKEPVCSACSQRPESSLFILSSRSKKELHRQTAMQEICASCSNTPVLEEIECDSIDCPVFYSRMTALKRSSAAADSELILRVVNEK